MAFSDSFFGSFMRAGRFTNRDRSNRAPLEINPIPIWCQATLLMGLFTVSVPAISEPFNWYVYPSAYISNSPIEVCEKVHADVKANSGAVIGNYRIALIDLEPTPQYKCYVQNWNGFGWWEQHWNINRSGDTCSGPNQLESIITGECFDKNEGNDKVCGISNPINPATGYKLPSRS